MMPLPTGPQAPRRTRRERDEGTALTEFVVVMPLFILLLFWSEFFVDVGLVKLKVEEAARYALWETAAQRDPAKVQAEVIDRFKDLSSPADVHNSSPIGARAFKSINITNVSIVTNIDAPFAGNLQLNWGSGGGFLSAILRAIGNFFDRTANAMVKKMKLETHREAQASIEFQVDNTLFPGGRINNAAAGEVYQINDPNHSAGRLTFRAKSPVMLIDTWKAWPSMYAVSNTNNNTDVYDTYSRNGGASAPENEVAARSKRIAFYGASSNFVFSIMNSLIGAVGFPKPFAMGTWKNDSGPICMLPGDNAKHSWVPGNGLGSQRVGNYIYPQSTSVLPMPVKSPNEQPATDRPRSTVPSYVHSGIWNGEGGLTSVAPVTVNTPTSNPYITEYKCRDAYYLGSTVPGIKRYKNPNANLQAFPLCR